MNGLVGALQFLTRIPIRTSVAIPHARVIPWFPVAGALIGAIVGGIVAGAAELVPMPVAAAVGVLCGLLVTGAFHEDGLADLADATAGGWTRERRQEILKDPRHGSYGVAALCGSIVLRIICLAVLGPATAFAGAIAAHALARTAAVGAMITGRPGDAPGLGASQIAAVRRGRALVGIVAGLAICAVATGWWVGPLAAAAVIAALVVGRVASRAFGGLNGDALGAIEQVAECLVLVVVTGLAPRHGLWWR